MTVEKHFTKKGVLPSTIGYPATADAEGFKVWWYGTGVSGVEVEFSDATVCGSNACRVVLVAKVVSGKINWHCGVHPTGASLRGNACKYLPKGCQNFCSSGGVTGTDSGTASVISGGTSGSIAAPSASGGGGGTCVPGNPRCNSAGCGALSRGQCRTNSGVTNPDGEDCNCHWQ